MKIFSLLLLSLVLSTQSFAQDKGHGGDGIAIEGKAIVNALSTMLANDQKQSFSQYSEINAAEFKKMADRLVIKTTVQLVKDKLGDEKTAINFIDNDGIPNILINISNYNSLMAIPRQQLIFHEVLGLMNLEVSNQYSISQRLTTGVNRPVFGLCQARFKKKTCKVGLKFDYVTRSIEGSYVCAGKETMDVSEDLIPNGATFKYVKLGNSYSSSQGFHYKDKYIEFEVASPAVTGMTTLFRATKRMVSLVKKDEFVSSVGTCELVY